ncbi:ECERIFERUM 16, r RST1 interacting protein [Hibiscus trionum]|uniref:ECERIFERUM 16, r RST1 interacting protein n=1 Tax=Hibiscus trionum TaxID=183268 RepID=A0A9W7M190_HIBTR|nr:ECERIFERUM 16, r RST1 interacting protein [Hibiscus trionum]
MMDAKALAKSKRAHSQHHSKKPHSIQKSKPPSSTGVNEPANSKKQTFKQIREKTQQAQRISALPSNWNRYEEEFDSGSEDPSQAPDIIVPKSKGADFRHLIAEAQSQSHSNPHSDALFSLDDILHGDFNQFVGSMLAVRGEGILSWTGNDNFVVDDSTTATPEASFLSLNLHALAEQLERVDLSERLFIEEDLLPPNLRSERSKVSKDQESQQTQVASDRKGAAKITEEITPNDLPDKVNFAAKIVEDVPFGPGSQPKDAILSNRGLGLIPEVQDDSISGQCGKFGESRALDSLNYTSVFNKKVPTFEAAAAEAELDMLLNSFSETEILDTPSSSSNKPSSESLPQYARKGMDSVKAPPIQSNFDGLLDDLLQETSTTVNRGIGSSNTAAVSSTFDDLLDDLLQETSGMVNPNGLSEQKVVKAASDNNVESSSSQPATKSKVLNDFDSWLDTI